MRQMFSTFADFRFFVRFFEFAFAFDLLKSEDEERIQVERCSFSLLFVGQRLELRRIFTVRLERRE